MYKILFFILISTYHMQAQGIYEFKAEGLTGESIDFSTFKGKKIMIVNTASECGYTPQYEGLEKLYQTYKDNNFVIIGFPSNEFGGQEPGSNQEIASFCQKNYGVTFPMAAKSVVKGEGISPLFDYLTKEAEKSGVSEPIKWNFTKILIDENGKLINVFEYKVEPMSDEVQAAVK